MVFRTQQAHGGGIQQEFHRFLSGVKAGFLA